MNEDEDVNEDGDGSGDDDSPDGPVADLESVDERIRRVEAIVSALESGEVDPEERAASIAEGKALVADLERDLEAAGEGTGE